MKTQAVSAGKIRIGGGAPLALIAGPCVIESEKTALAIATRLAGMARRLKIPLVFKASYDKANRTSGESFRGPGLSAGLRILARIKALTGLPVLTDIHEAWQAAEAARVADILQIPAFLCRQTDLLAAAGRTGRPVNIKKAQFMSPGDMERAAAKVRAHGNGGVLLTERGTSFGYHNLVVDFRSIPRMAAIAPVVFDASHSVQLPAGAGHASGGEREFVPVLARAACAAGIDALFVEVHPDPGRAKSDGPNSWPLSRLPGLWEECAAFHRLAARL